MGDVIGNTRFPNRRAARERAKWRARFARRPENGRPRPPLALPAVRAKRR